MPDLTKEQFLAHWGSRPVPEIRKGYLEQTGREAVGKTRTDLLEECWAAMSGEEPPIPAPAPAPAPRRDGPSYEARFAGADPNLKATYFRAGLKLTRIWQPIAPSAAQLIELRADARVQLRVV